MSPIKFDPAVMPQYIRDIDKLYSPNLHNLEETNPKILIVFSGTPGSGKTHVAKEIEEKFKAVRINKDQIWKVGIQPMFEKDLSLEDRNVILKNYLDFKVDELKKSSNGLIILDKSIDRTFPEIEKWAKANDFKVFIVRMITSKATVKNRIRERESHEETVQDYFKHVDRWFEENEKFNQEYKADFVINEYSYDKDIKKLLSLLSQIVITKRD